MADLLYEFHKLKYSISLSFSTPVSQPMLFMDSLILKLKDIRKYLKGQTYLIVSNTYVFSRARPITDSNRYQY